MLNNKTINKIFEFRENRNWKQFHNAKDLAISINLEAAELLECFQWTGSNTNPKNPEEARKEIADILTYLIYLIDELDTDIDEVILDKLKENEMKYPIEKSKNSSKKYTEL